MINYAIDFSLLALDQSVNSVPDTALEGFVTTPRWTHTSLDCVMTQAIDYDLPSTGRERMHPRLPHGCPLAAITHLFSAKPTCCAIPSRTCSIEASHRLWCRWRNARCKPGLRHFRKSSVATRLLMAPHPWFVNCPLQSLGRALWTYVAPIDRHNGNVARSKIRRHVFVHVVTASVYC